MRRARRTVFRFSVPNGVVVLTALAGDVIGGLPVLLAAGLIFLAALVFGVWKYWQMATSEDHLAHPYVDVAHRAALLYSFATRVFMVALIVGEVGGFAVVLAGFVRAQLL